MKLTPQQKLVWGRLREARRAVMQLEAAAEDVGLNPRVPYCMVCGRPVLDWKRGLSDDGPYCEDCAREA